MSRSVNFSAGPAALPEAVLEAARDELLDHGGLGASVMEISHRSPAFDQIAESSEARLRRLMGLDEQWTVLFLAGGATQQFSVIPRALARSDLPGAYEVHGHWGRKALRIAREIGPAVCVAESAPEEGIRPPESWDLPDRAAYLHLTSNETIEGVQFPVLPSAPWPLVVDMSSDILSRRFDLADIGVIYASAQKNLGPAGITVVVVRQDVMARVQDGLPQLLDWRAQAAAGSRLNTPATFSWYLLERVLAWLESEGGVAAIESINQRKADLLYAAIDGSDYYRNDIPGAVRSRMNVPFHLADESQTGRFVADAEAAGLLGLKGHRAVGGLRASRYNAVPESGVERLVAFMSEFERRNG